jgi:hypothetical protein
MCPSRFSAMRVVRHVRLTFFGASDGPQAIRAFKSSVARRFVSWSRDCRRNSQPTAELRTPMSVADLSTRSNKSTFCDVPHVLKQLTCQSAFKRGHSTSVSADLSLGWSQHCIGAIAIFRQGVFRKDSPHLAPRRAPSRPSLPLPSPLPALLPLQSCGSVPQSQPGT